MKWHKIELLILLSALIIGPAAMAEDLLWVDHHSGPAYGLTQIPVQLENSETDVNDFSFRFNFDSGALTYEGFEPGVLSSGFDVLDVTELSPGNLEISGSDTTGIPFGNDDTLILLAFYPADGWSTNLLLSDLEDDLAGFGTADGSFSTCIPEMAWLSRNLPESCTGGEVFDIYYSYQGGTASVIQTSETLPEGWQVTAPPWDNLVGTTYTWDHALTSCTVLPPSDGVTGGYIFFGETISDHWCNGQVQHEITGDQTIHLHGIDPTPTPVCLHTGDVNLNFEISAEDAQMTFSIALGSYAPTWDEHCAANCNGDDNVTAGDAQAVFLAALGLADCEDPIIIPTSTPTFTPTPWPTVTPTGTPTPNQGFTVSGNIYEFPEYCMGYMRGWGIELLPLGWYTTSDVNSGFFSFDDVPNGEYWISATPGCNPFGCWPDIGITVDGGNITGIAMCPEPL